MKKINMILSRNDISFIIGSFIFITALSTILYFDFSTKIDIGDAQKIGTITFKKRIAQRKYKSQIIWENIAKNETLYNHDTIRTADMSDAIIKLIDGTIIELDENTMILLSLSKNSFNIDFSHGGIATKRDSIKGTDIKNLELKSKGTTFAIKKSDLKLTKQKNKNMELTVNSGKVTLTTKDSKKILDKSQKAILLDSGKLDRIYKLQFTLSKPDDGTFLTTPGSRAKINFSWERSSKTKLQ
ncbi:FecR domain-containing protein, partial [Spirochaetota bacterium]